MANTGYNFAKAISLTKYQPAFRVKSDEYSWEWKSIATSKTTKANQEKMFSFAGLPMAQERGVLEPAYMRDMSELDATTITVAKYSIGTTFSDELLSDNLHIKDFMGEAGEAAGESHAATVDYVVAQVLNRAFNSSYSVFDGTELCGTHTLSSGDTYTNKLGTPATLAWTSAWSMIKLLDSMRSQSGLYIKDDPYALIYHPSYHDEALKIKGATGEPDTASLNNPNTLSGYSLKLIPCRYLTTSTAWFVVTKKFVKDLVFLWNWQKRTKQWPDNDNGGIKIKTEQRFGVGVRDFTHIVGTPGA